MCATTNQVVSAVQSAGLRSFTSRKLERWANLGAIPHARRKGKGRGKGWQFDWPDEAVPIALFIADAFAWQKSRRFKDAVLWAWLRGAPISLSLIRRYLEANYRTLRTRVDRALIRRRRGSEDELLDQIDRLTRAYVYWHGALRASGLSTKERRAVLQQVIASLVGKRWAGRSSREASAAYRKAWNATMESLGIPWDTDPKETRRQQRFFQLRRLESLARTIPEHDLLAARDEFARDWLIVGKALERRGRGVHVPKATMRWAEAKRKEYDAYFHVARDPAWVAALFIYRVLRRAGSLDRLVASRGAKDLAR